MRFCFSVFVLLRQTALDGFVGFLHSFLDVLRALSLRIDGVVHGECHAAALDELACAGKDFKGTVNREWDDGQLEFVSQLECPFLERAHLAGVGAAAFREHDERCAVDERVAGLLDGLLYFLRAGFVHEDVADWQAFPTKGMVRSDFFIIHLKFLPRKP